MSVDDVTLAELADDDGIPEPCPECGCTDTVLPDGALEWVCADCGRLA